MTTKPPPANVNFDAIADRAKHAFYTGSKLLADVQYRLAELAGTGLLAADVSERLQDKIFRAWEELYSGTLGAVLGCDTDDPTWCDPENTYSDGRTVRTRIRLEGRQDLESGWPHNKYLRGDGPVAEYPRGTESYIASVDGEDGPIFVGSPQVGSDDFPALRERLREGRVQQPLLATEPLKPSRSRLNTGSTSVKRQ
jgi:hypothetical protein